MSEFIFKLPNGEVVGIARNLEEFLHALEDVPKKCIEYHHSGGHFKPRLRDQGYEKLAEEIEKIEASGHELRLKLVDLAHRCLSEIEASEEKAVKTLYPGKILIIDDNTLSQHTHCSKCPLYRECEELFEMFLQCAMSDYYYRCPLLKKAVEKKD